MSKTKYHVYLTAEEYRKVVEALVLNKNELTATRHYTDAVDELLIKLSRPRIRNVKVVCTS